LRIRKLDRTTKNIMRTCRCSTSYQWFTYKIRNLSWRIFPKSKRKGIW